MPTSIMNDTDKVEYAIKTLRILEGMGNRTIGGLSSDDIIRQAIEALSNPLTEKYESGTPKA